MLKFYRFATSLFLALVFLTVLLVYGGLALSKIQAPLLPNTKSALPWVADIDPKIKSGKTMLSVDEESDMIGYDFFLSSLERYPYTSYAFNFTDVKQEQHLVDLTPYDIVSFKIRCSPRNILLFVLFTYDDKATVLSDTSTYRVNSTFFTCDKGWRTVVIQLNNLDTPDWWLQNSGLELVDRAYQLDRVISFAFVNSLQSPRDVASSLEVSDITLIGDDRRYIYSAIVLTVLLWVLFVLWFVRQYLRELISQVKDKIKQDRPLIAYQRLTIEPQKDKDKSALFSYLATQYSSPEISAESIAGELGVNRNKINDILKQEFDLTFSAYVNKLRLAESARLLSEQGDLNIAQIAYNVGFNNVTYFNKLFKAEYGCTPKTFKNNYKEGGA